MRAGWGNGASNTGAGAGRAIGVLKVAFLLSLATEITGSRCSLTARRTGHFYGLVGWCGPGRGMIERIQPELAQLVAEILIPAGHVVYPLQSPIPNGR